ncbi:uncharacterized protein DUF3263 [Curtobacterium flaccumfaciens]|uniref:Uncharacterized protein DUF3263 n=1 Tax=Curtobacterium flaccumfaciens TaxID=2035 RepID=A0A4R6DDI6_9MICO|nr:uncharacterized protein DUF3263 [Curtobacterium flaccumfaciens]
MCETRYPTVIGTAVTATPADERSADQLSELAVHVLAFEHERARQDRSRHDRTKEAEIRVEFEMSPARYYQVLNRVIDSPAALAYDPQLVSRLQRLRHARTSARAARSFVAPGAAPEGREEER